jgi:hypothetical protein
MRRIHPAAAAALVVVLLVVLVAASHYLSNLPLPTWAWWALLVLSAAPLAASAVVIAAAPTYPSLSAVRALRISLASWLVIAVFSSMIGRASTASVSEPGIELPAASAVGLGLLAGLACLVVIAIPVFLVRTRPARREFAQLVESGQARRPEIAWHGGVIDEGAGSVGTRRSSRWGGPSGGQAEMSTHANLPASSALPRVEEGSPDLSTARDRVRVNAEEDRVTRSARVVCGALITPVVLLVLVAGPMIVASSSSPAVPLDTASLVFIGIGLLVLALAAFVARKVRSTGASLSMRIVSCGFATAAGGWGFAASIASSSMWPGLIVLIPCCLVWYWVWPRG